MALADSALLEMIEMLRTADGGELMRRRRSTGTISRPVSS